MLMKQLLAGKVQLSRAVIVLWYITAAAAVAGLFVSLPGYYQWYVVQPMRLHFTQTQMTLAILGGITSIAGVLLCILLSAFLFFRKPGEKASMYVSFYLLANSLLLFGPSELIEYQLVHTIGTISWRIQAGVFVPMMIVLLLTFPNGIITPARFRWLIPVSCLSSLLSAFAPTSELWTFSSPMNMVSAVLIILAVGAQVYRYLRKATPVERQQMKLVVYGLVLQIFLFVISSVFFTQIPSDDRAHLRADGLVSNFLWWVALIILPVSFTMAVVRSHLWDIDVVIRRTVIYGALTITLTAVYAITVVLMQGVFQIIAGHDSPIAVVLSTLVIASLFYPFRRRIQSIIDRRFFRSKYNAEQTLASFQQRMRGRIDLEQVEGELTTLVQATIQPEWTALWMRRPRKKGE